MRKTYDISTRWFPTCEFSAIQHSFTDQVFLDFDQQSEMFDGHDQSYLQLSPGAFQGRFLSGSLGKAVFIHMEYCNQAFEQEVSGAPDHFSFGIVLSEDNPLRANGHTFGCNDLFVLPPEAHLHVLTPTDAVVMAVTIHRDRLLSHSGLTVPVGEWLSGLSDRVSFLQTRYFAQRLREDAISALESATQLHTQEDQMFLEEALLSAIASGLSLEWASGANMDQMKADRAYARFRACRKTLEQDYSSVEMSAGVTQSLNASQRTIQQAFSSNVAMGPLTYLRVLRLHSVRHALVDPDNSDTSIGDIAAQHGFWDWSRFSTHYRRHFGELPSVTKASFRKKS